MDGLKSILRLFNRLAHNGVGTPFFYTLPQISQLRNKLLYTLYDSTANDLHFGQSEQISQPQIDPGPADNPPK